MSGSSDLPSLVAPEHEAASPAQTSAVKRPRPNPLAPLAYLLVLIGSAFTAYWQMFDQFARYDDSGFFIHSIRLFSQGQALYDRVWTDYGPFSYEVWAAVFGLLGQTVSTDSGRLAVIVVWLLTSLLLGVSCQRLTGRLSIGVAVQVLSFAVLKALTYEPMHASGVACALFGVAVVTISFLLPGRPRAALLILGAIVAALALTKINIGGFAAIAVAYAIVMTFSALRRVVPLRRLAAIALVAVGPVLMSGNLSQRWAQEYAILAMAGAAALVLVSDFAEDPECDDADEARRWIAWLLIGFAACAAVVIGIVLAAGTSLGAMFQETVTVPLHQAHAFTNAIALPVGSVFWAVVAVIVAAVIRHRRADFRRPREPELAGALGRILVALAIWLSITVTRNFAFAITLAWVAAIPSSRDDGSLQGRFVRLLLPSLAVLQTLVAYPVAGTQVGFGSLLLLVCGAVCFADGWSDLEEWGAAEGTVDSFFAPRRMMPVLTTALVVALAFLYVVRPMQSSHSAYAANPALPIAGATRLHLPAAQSTAFTHITKLLQARCLSVITLPGMLSFNLWSGLPAPSGMTAEPFWHLLDAAQERTALASARAAPKLCSVSNKHLAAFWDNGQALPRVPLVRFIKQDFTPIARYEGGYVVSVRSP